MEKGSIINNRYEILSRIGTGGMSDVYKAADHKLNRNVAIKVLKKEYSSDKNFVSKFRVEAQSAASLIHPNIVNVYDVGEDNGVYYIVMELIEGITLKSYIEKKGRLSVKEAISIAIQIANGIECAHNNQIIHRDIKPQNIMISREGKVKVTDFGIAKATSSNTVNGNAMGSVHYISPEQANDSSYVDERSDIYSLGITIFEMLTGKVPFNGESAVAIAIMHIKNNVPSLRNYLEDIPISIEKIVLKCTQNSKELRYPKISLLIADLKKALTNPDEDFVQINSSDVTDATIMITAGDIGRRDSLKTDGKNESQDNNIDEANSPKMDKVIGIGGVVVGIVALVIVSVILTMVLTDNGLGLPSSLHNAVEETTDPRMTLVPNVIGMSCDEAQQTLNDNSLGYRYNSVYVFSDLYPKDYVVAQSENPGDSIKKNSTIELTVSKGAEKIQVPSDLAGKDLDEATSMLEQLGLKWNITYEYSGKNIGTVISCEPKENASVNKNDMISLTVSRGQKDTGVLVSTVPNVVNKKLAKAQESITAADLKVKSVRYEYSDDVQKGYVIRQSVKPGTSAPRGSSVSIVVSKGSDSKGQYSGVYTFALEDLLGENGALITQGTVSILLNGEAQTVAPQYSDISKWTGDYTYTFYGDIKGKATVELLVDGKIVIEDTVILN